MEEEPFGREPEELDLEHLIGRQVMQGELSIEEAYQSIYEAAVS